MLRVKNRRKLHDPRASSNGLRARAACPDANSLALDRVLAAEGASVLGVLCDLHLTDLLSQRGTITSSVLADNANLLSSLGLIYIYNEYLKT
jgi:hypothetical protein